MIADELSRIAMSSRLGETLARAVEIARAQGNLEVTLEHMLLALCEDQDAGLVLAASNIDVARLKTDTLGYLATQEKRAAPGQRVDPAVSLDLRRIMEAAAAAARGGRRREINGAIVLAALVGDGRSPAAHLLQAQGLTFEGAIRALQRGAGMAPPQPSANTEDILASARERVQSRTVPSTFRSRVEQSQVDEEESAEPNSEAPEPQPEDDDGSQAEPAPSQIAAAAEPTPELAEQLPREVLVDPDPVAEAEPPADDGFAGLGAELSQRPKKATSATRDKARLSTSILQPPPIPGAAMPSSWAPQPPPPDRPAPPPAAQPPAVPPPLPSGQGDGEAPRPGLPPLDRWSELKKPQRPEGIGAASDAPRAFPPFARAQELRTNAASAPQPVARPVPAQRAEIGQLVENIPRSMRVAIPALVEVRVAKADVQALAEGLQGGAAAYRHEVTVTKAMSVRLRAPDGGFYIETASPETQWIESTMLLAGDDYASWRWHVTPREKGRKRLQLIISARTVGTDGLAAETALPDQVVTVRVRTNYAKTMSHWVGWGVAALVGGLLAKFGEGVLDAGIQVVAKLTAG
jgi:neural Wiskott-Aldrich syndrome protein